MAIKKKVASKKTVTKKTVAKKSTGLAVTKQNPNANMPATVQEELAQLQKRVAAPTGSRIKINNAGKFEIPNYGEAPENIDVVIVDFAARNDYYVGRFDPSKITPPTCAASGFGTNDDLIPFDDSPDKQADSCNECPFNEWGSNGKGKRCKNSRMVAVLTPDASGDQEILTLSVSATGLKGFDSMITQMAVKFGNVPRAFAVEISPKPAGQSFTFGFSKPRLLDPKVAAYMNTRVEEARAIVNAPTKFDNV